MISNEASASELAISSAITRSPSRDAPPDETRSSGARPVCAPALAKIPPATMGPAAPRSDRRHDADHTFFFRPVGRIRVHARILVHTFIIYFYHLQPQTA